MVIYTQVGNFMPSYVFDKPTKGNKKNVCFFHPDEKLGNVQQDGVAAVVPALVDVAAGRGATHQVDLGHLGSIL
jgi:hypothetical protein